MSTNICYCPAVCSPVSLSSLMAWNSGRISKAVKQQDSIKVCLVLGGNESVSAGRRTSCPHQVVALS